MSNLLDEVDLVTLILLFFCIFKYKNRKNCLVKIYASWNYDLVPLKLQYNVGSESTHMDEIMISLVD